MTQREIGNPSTLAGSSAGLGSQDSGPSVPDIASSCGSFDDGTIRLRAFLERTVTSHQEGLLTKHQAIVAAVNELDKWTSEGVDDERRSAAFESFMALLIAAGPRSLSPTADSNARKSGVGPEAGIFGGRAAGKRKRRDQPDEVLDNLSQKDEIDEEDHLSSRRRRLRVKDVPWHTATPHSRHPSCAKTSKILVTLGMDLPRARLLLRNAENLPQGIPSSQWDRILRGEPLDFDHLLASRFGLNLDTERRGRLGEAKVKEKVKSALDWFSAFQRAKKATIFVFKHREEEFNSYENRICRLFEAKHPNFHSCVILFDRAVRSIVRGGQNILLTDQGRFEYITESILHADGTNYLKSRLSQRQDGESEGDDFEDSEGDNRSSVESNH